MSPVQFTNFTEVDFVCKFDGKPWTFPAGKTIVLEAEKACHFAKHLVDRELHREKLQVTDGKKHELIKLISVDLKFDEKRKHQVTLDHTGSLEPVIPGADSATTALNMGVDKSGPVETPLAEMTRSELEEKAVAMGCVPEVVKKAKNKTELVKMIEAGPKDAEKPSEADFEGAQ